jgi:hypothetical protein
LPCTGARSAAIARATVSNSDWYGAGATSKRSLLAGVPAMLT